METNSQNNVKGKAGRQPVFGSNVETEALNTAIPVSTRRSLAMQSAAQGKATGIIVNEALKAYFAAHPIKA